jgi:hypothetical protein
MMGFYHSFVGAVFIGEVILLPLKWGFSQGARLGVSEHADDNDWLPFVPALTPCYRRISVATSKAGNSNRCATIVIMEWGEQNCASGW